MKNPELGDSLAAAHPNEATLNLLRLRRSTPADFMIEPGPNTDTLSDMLRIAARVPDHRRVVPFRFIRFQGDARVRFGEVLETAFMAHTPDANEGRVAIERNRFCRAPVVIAVISSVNREHRTPEWEQILSAGAVCQNLLLAANAHGFAAQWLTEWYAFDEVVAKAMALTENERIAGFVYIGSTNDLPKERGRPDLNEIISDY